MKDSTPTTRDAPTAADPSDRSLRPGEFATLCVLAEGRGHMTLDKRFIRALTSEIVALRARLAARGESLPPDHYLATETNDDDDEPNPEDLL